MEAASRDLSCFFYIARLDPTPTMSTRGMIETFAINNAKQKVTGWIWVSEFMDTTYCAQYIEGQSEILDGLVIKIVKESAILEIYAKGSIKSRLFGNWSIFSMRCQSKILKENKELVISHMTKQLGPRVMDSFKKFASENVTELSEMLFMDDFDDIHDLHGKKKLPW